MVSRRHASYPGPIQFVLTTVVFTVAGCPAVEPSGSGGSSPSCDAEQICRDLRATDEPVDDLPLLQGALEFCDRLADGSLDSDGFCGFCDQAGGGSEDVAAFCRDPVEQIVANELDFVAKLEEIEARVENGACLESAPFDSAVVGNCDEQTAFLLLDWTVEGERLRTSHYYDSNTGELLGIVFDSTISMPPCCGRFEWPGELSCATPTVVDAICGSSLQRDDPIEVP